MKNFIYLSFIAILVIAAIGSAGTFDLMYDNFDSGILNPNWQLIGIDSGESINAEGNCLSFTITDTAGTKNEFGGINLFLRFSAKIYIPSGVANGKQADIAFSDSQARIPVNMLIINENGINKLKVKKRLSSGTVVYENIADLSAEIWNEVIFEVYVKGTQANPSCYYSVALNDIYLKNNIYSYPHSYPVIADIYNGYNAEGAMNTLVIESTMSGVKLDDIRVSNNYIPFAIRGDLDENGIVDLKDFAIFALNWCYEK